MIADISTQINIDLNDKNNEIFQRYFTKEQLISSIIQTLLNRFPDINTDEEKQITANLNSLIGKLSKDNIRGRFLLVMY